MGVHLKCCIKKGLLLIIATRASLKMHFLRDSGLQVFAPCVALPPESIQSSGGVELHGWRECRKLPRATSAFDLTKKSLFL